MAHRIAVAASGGRDSTALLHATARAARGQGVEVTALHVHHGLMPQADAWQAQLKRQCDRWARAGLPVRLRSHRLESKPGRGESIEAWARRERYAALAAMAAEEGVNVILLAHHRQDQAETFLLQALRGAGPAGLAAMPRRAERQGITWLRPWLDQPGEAIASYVQRFRLAHVLDGSNADPRFARSLLRQAVWPALSKSFGHADAALAGAADLAHEAAQCMQEWGALDLAAVGATAERLPVGPWVALSGARRANVLRLWLRQHVPEGIPNTLVHRLLKELPGARTGASWPCTSAQLRLHRGELRCQLPQQLAEKGAALPVSTAIDLHEPGRYAMPKWGGEFVITAARRGGVSSALMAHAQVRARQGAEQFQLSPHSIARSLKKQFQAMGVGTHERVVPLLWCKDQLVFVPGLGIDARALARAGEAGVHIEWRVAAPPQASA